MLPFRDQAALYWRGDLFRYWLNFFRNSIRLSVGALAVIAYGGSVALGQGRDHPSVNSPDVIVDLGRPNVWTMDQAHYLLERNRVRDLGLQTADLGNLDANEINGIRIDSLRSLISGSASFDTSIAPANRAKMTDYTAKLSEYNSLLSRRDAAQMTSDSLSTRLANATKTAAILNADPDTSTAAKAAANAEVTRLTSLKTQSDADVTALTTQMGSAPALPSLATGTPPDLPMSADLGDDANFKSLLSNYAKGIDSTKIAASIRLDNYINLQYEMVAKQLTLLRDQAGPDKKVLFIELPQSVYQTNKLRLYPYVGGWWGAHLLQTWWRLDEAFTLEPKPQTVLDDTEALQSLKSRPPTREELRALTVYYRENQHKCGGNFMYLEAFFEPDSTCAQNITDVLNPSQNPASPNLYMRLPGSADELAKATTPNTKIQKLGGASTLKFDLSTFLGGNEVTSLLPDDCKKDPARDPTGQLCSWDKTLQFKLLLSPLGRANRPDDNHRTLIPELSSPADEEPMYTLDLIPRQSGLNVADANLTSRSYGFAGLFKALSGFGAQGKYERQRNQFGQFIQEETYASAFGKGSFEFGWTFGPLPGTNHLAPGLRTTYAVVVVPKYTRYIRLYGMGCAYRRRNAPFNPFALEEFETARNGGEQHRLNLEECGAEQVFDVEVPSGEDNFQVNEVRYSSVAAGQRVTIELDGTFGDQIGLLVNGTPLQKVPSIGQPMLLPTTYSPSSYAAEAGVQGVFELVHENQLIASFVMPPSFSGTPHLTLVTAGREGLLDEYSIWPTEDHKYRKAFSKAKPMFLQPSTILRIDRKLSDDKKSVKLTIYGKGFTDHAENELVVNGTKLDPDSAGPALTKVNTFRRVNSATLAALVDRDSNFPRWGVDYMPFGIDGQLGDINATQDDDLAPDVEKCEYTVITADNKTTLSFTVSGNYFTASFTPTTLKPLTIASPILASQHEWDFTADAATSWQNGAVLFKGPKVTDNFSVKLGITSAQKRGSPPHPGPVVCVNTTPAADPLKKMPVKRVSTSAPVKK